jgi:2-phospho-L-lactate guanylyltransferase
MGVIAVPVKPLDRAKSRLSPLLTPSERASLSLVMLHGVIEACLEQPGWEVWVISRDRAVLEESARHGVRPVPEQGRTLLSAVRQVEAAIAGRPSELAVVLADLPLVSATVLATALAKRENAPVVASPAASDGGTNLLLRRPPDVIPARFGPDSFARHRWEAYRRGLTFTVAAVAGLGFDLDRPEDVARLLEMPEPSRTRSACVEMGLPARLPVLA